MGEPVERRGNVNLERHLQTILISICTGALFFAANYVYTDNQSKAVQKTQLETLTSQVMEMRAELKALQNNYARRDELKELELRVRVIEKGR